MAKSDGTKMEYRRLGRSGLQAHRKGIGGGEPEDAGEAKRDEDEEVLDVRTSEGEPVGKVGEGETGVVEAA